MTEPEYLERLRDVIASHSGYDDFASCQDPEKRASIATLAQRISDEVLEQGVVAGMVAYPDLQGLLQLNTPGALRATISRDKAFPAAAIDRKLYRRSDIQQYLESLETARSRQKGGRPRNALRDDPK